jgi:hypothetical protein
MERKDLVKLGGIVTGFLNLHPYVDDSKINSFTKTFQKANKAL